MAKTVGVDLKVKGNAATTVELTAVNSFFILAKQPKAMVLLAAGINCDRETVAALELAGFEAEKIHLNELVANPDMLLNYHLLVLPGGFSYGDDLGSGKVLASRLKLHLLETILTFWRQGGLILGICNGFQVLVKLGLLPQLDGEVLPQVSLTFNQQAKFENRWVYLKISSNSPCVFTKDIWNLLYLPVRHGEGRFIVKNELTLSKIRKNQLIAVKYVDAFGLPGPYPVNPNGSIDDVAGICDQSGRIFGLMPHPEVFVRATQHPAWSRHNINLAQSGLKIFHNAIAYIRENLL